VSREPIRRVKEAAPKLGTRFLREAALDVVKAGESTLQEMAAALIHRGIVGVPRGPGNWG